MQETVKMKTTLEDLDSIPDQYLQAVAHYIYGLRNLSETEDLTKPHLRSSVVQIYPLFVFLYTLLIFFGVVFNIFMMFHIFKNKLHRDPTYAYLINIAISDVIKCIFVLPFTLVVLLLQNWIFGKFLCYFLPIMQDVPFHVSMMTYLLIAGDRYRVLSDPGKPRIPAFVCSLGSWFFAVCIALPHPIYTVHIDLSEFQNDFDGLGICITNLVDNIQQYMRGLFLLT
ncbi:probable G-protein coupled receptor 83 [Chelonus insularis]|uniref:probable G-protein coupled receptor 83 n=1 Tax=Chelonus insularis TaxID=460826 RepID=UPI001588C951|nr:probable G-protein coupled receptor 83 [Chelonus insularis]